MLHSSCVFIYTKYVSTAMPLNIYRLTVEKNTTSTIKIAPIGIEAD